MGLSLAVLLYGRKEGCFTVLFMDEEGDVVVDGFQGGEDVVRGGGFVEGVHVESVKRKNLDCFFF